MKKQITKFGALALLLVTSFACEKKELGLAEARENEKFAVVTYLEDKKGNLEKAIIVGTKEELEAALMKDGPAVLKKVSTKANILVTTGTVGPVVDPFDPYQACWDEIMAHAEAHAAEWQALANQTCQVIWRCVTCDKTGGGLFMEFFIHPNSRRCNFMLAEKFEERFNLNPFGFGEGDYDSDEVMEFIQNAR